MDIIAGQFQFLVVFFGGGQQFVPGFFKVFYLRLDFCFVNAGGHMMDAGIDFEAIAPYVDGKFISAFIRARKPAK